MLDFLLDFILSPLLTRVVEGYRGDTALWMPSLWLLLAGGVCLVLFCVGCKFESFVLITLGGLGCFAFWLWAWARSRQD